MVCHPQVADLKGRVAVLTVKNALLIVRQTILIPRAPLILEGVAVLAVVDPPLAHRQSNQHLHNLHHLINLNIRNQVGKFPRNIALVLCPYPSANMSVRRIRKTTNTANSAFRINRMPHLIPWEINQFFFLAWASGQQSEDIYPRSGARVYFLFRQSFSASSEGVRDYGLHGEW